MTLIRLFFVFFMMSACVLADAETSVVKKSIAFPTTIAGKIIPLELESKEIGSAEKEVAFLAMINLVVNGGLFDVVGVDIEFTDGYVSDVKFDVITNGPKKNRVRFFGFTKRYPGGILDTPSRYERWKTLENQYKLSAILGKSSADDKENSATLVFYLEKSPAEGLLSAEYMTKLRQGLSLTFQ